MITKCCGNCFFYDGAGRCCFDLNFPEGEEPEVDFNDRACPDFEVSEVARVEERKAKLGCL